MDMVKLKGPKDAASVTFEGQQYPVKNGMVEVPDAAVDLLTGGKHGWAVANDKHEKAGK